MATITLDLIQYHSAAKPFDPADFVTITGTGFSFGDLSRPQVEAFAANHVDVIDASDDVLALTTLQYEGLGPVALTASDDVILRDWSVILNSGTIQQIGGLAAKGVDSIDAIDGTLIFSTAQYAALGAIPIAPGDRLHVNGTWRGERIVGRNSNDTLKGLSGNDALLGGFGDDRLFGGAGKDYLTGGGGKDAFAFNTKPNKKTNLDKVTDFSVKDNSVYLDNAIFKKIGRGSETKPGKLNKEFFVTGSKAQEADDYLIYNKSKGILYYDPDGSGQANAVEICSLSKHLKMTYRDFFVI